MEVGLYEHHGRHDHSYLCDLSQLGPVLGHFRCVLSLLAVDQLHLTRTQQHQARRLLAEAYPFGMPCHISQFLELSRHLYSSDSLDLASYVNMLLSDVSYDLHSLILQLFLQDQVHPSLRTQQRLHPL